MEKELSFSLNNQLFADKKGKGEVIDADEELNNVPLSQINDNTANDDEDYIEGEDEDSDEDETEYLYDEDESEEEDKDSKEKKEEPKEEPKDKKVEPKEDEKKPEVEPKKSNPPQDRDKNHEQKLLREQREAEEKARKENFTKGFIAALGGKNPYTGEEIKTEDDIHEAQVMIEAKKRGLDPIQDYSKMDKLLRQEEREKLAKQEQEKVESAKRMQDDFKKFSTQYPNEDINEFLGQVEKKGYADLVGNVPLTRIKQIIDDVDKRVSDAVTDNNDMKEARRQSTPGSVNSGGDANGEFYTKEELSKLSPSEVKANWAKVERSYDRLNHMGKGGKR